MACSICSRLNSLEKLWKTTFSTVCCKPDLHAVSSFSGSGQSLAAKLSVVHFEQTEISVSSRALEVFTIMRYVNPHLTFNIITFEVHHYPRLLHSVVYWWHFPYFSHKTLAFVSFYFTFFQTFIITYTVSQKKHPRHFQLYLENQLSNFNNFWHKYSW